MRMTEETPRDYIHGYGASEAERLHAQATSVRDLLHGDTRYPAGSVVLEVGCGTGEQTVSLARHSPGARIVAFDRETRSLVRARARVESAALTNVAFHRAELFSLPFRRESFDHLFVCFVLEHLTRPLDALVLLKDFLRPGGTITVFEGDHGSPFFHPESEAADRAIRCQVELQRRAGTNACIGRELYPLLTRAGYARVVVSPRVVYVDGSRPELIESFTKGTFTAMVEAVRTQAIAQRLIDAETFDRGIADLDRTASRDGVFFYTFFKGTATLD
jgi:ubiquinone/menaquinone biosynthesis C-methylase UbiE